MLQVPRSFTSPSQSLPGRLQLQLSSSQLGAVGDESCQFSFVVFFILPPALYTRKGGFCFPASECPCPQSTAIAQLSPFTSCSPGSHHQTRGTAEQGGLTPASRGCTGQGCARSQEGKEKVTACHPGPRHQPHFTVKCALWQCFCE